MQVYVRTYVFESQWISKEFYEAWNENYKTETESERAQEIKQPWNCLSYGVGNQNLENSKWKWKIFFCKAKLKKKQRN